jgi:hypothetical protein
MFNHLGFGLFTEMHIRYMPLVFKVEKWNPAIGSNGALDVAWFRIKGIPYKRSFLNGYVWLGG